MKKTSQLKRSGFKQPTYEEVIKKQKEKILKKKPSVRKNRTIKKKKPKTIGWYKKKLWKEFSIYIRQRDHGQCFTCPTKKHWKEMQAGHMIPKSVGGFDLYFHEKNVHVQCYNCNINQGGAGAMYAKYFIDKYGQEEFDKLVKMKFAIAPHMTPKEKIAWYEEKIAHYKALNKEPDI